MFSEVNCVESILLPTPPIASATSPPTAPTAKPKALAVVGSAF